jgi:hypothetical protein
MIRAFLLGVAAIAFCAMPAKADTLFEVENARAKARAGGPVSSHDADMLDRWGTTSGTRGYYVQDQFVWYLDRDRRRDRRRTSKRRYDY